MADHLRTELVLDALGMAVAARGGADQAGGVIAMRKGHQYTANDYLDFCQARQLRPSVGTTGICWDKGLLNRFGRR